MTSEFVRYSPDIESIDPHLDELLKQIIDFWEKKGRESPNTEGTGRAVRGAPAKTFGVAKAEVEIVSDLAAPYAQGIYATPGRHGALIRFSSASNHLGPDMLLGPVLGFAIKMFGIEGPKLVEDEPNSPTFDLVLKNSPTFIANTAKHYLFIEQIGNDSLLSLPRKSGLPRALDRLRDRQGDARQSEWAWDELGALLKAAQTPVRNPLPSTYALSAIVYAASALHAAGNFQQANITAYTPPRSTRRLRTRAAGQRDCRRSAMARAAPAARYGGAAASSQLHAWKRALHAARPLRPPLVPGHEPQRRNPGASRFVPPQARDHGGGYQRPKCPTPPRLPISISLAVAGPAEHQHLTWCRSRVASSTHQHRAKGGRHRRRAASPVAPNAVPFASSWSSRDSRETR
jgi:hypothetical protein